MNAAMPYNFDQLIDRRGTDSEKWDRYDPDVLPLWVADMDFPSAEPIVQALRERVEHRVFGYTNEVRGLREAVLRWLEEQHRWKVQAEDIMFLPGVVVGFNLAARAFGGATLNGPAPLPHKAGAVHNAASSNPYNQVGGDRYLVAAVHNAASSNPSAVNKSASYSHTASGVLIQTPVYPPFLSVGKNAGIPLLENPLLPPEPSDSRATPSSPTPETGQYQIDFDHFKSCMQQKPSLFLLCNPHNPVGRVYSPSELERMAEACLRAGALICSDEIHADLVFSGYRHVPIASIDPEIGQRTITLMAPSKTFNIPSLELAFAVIPNPEIRKRFQEARRGLVGEVNLFGMVAARAAYQEGTPWLQEVLRYLQENRDYVKKVIQERLPGIRMNNPEGTYLAWLDCRELIQKNSAVFKGEALKDGAFKAKTMSDETCKKGAIKDTDSGSRASRDGSIRFRATGAADFFLKHARVGLNEGATFGTGGEGHVRLNFACPRSILEAALTRMEEAVQRIYG